MDNRSTKARGNKHRLRHGHSNSRTYNTWRSMRSRCDNPRSKGYPWYGQRGISYHESWKSFDCFLSDMGERPEGLELDRIDSDGNYYKENCRWVTRKENLNNRKHRGIGGIHAIKIKRSSTYFQKDRESCIYGHSYKEVGYYLTKAGTKNCRECKKISSRKSKITVTTRRLKQYEEMKR